MKCGPGTIGCLRMNVEIDRIGRTDRSRCAQPSSVTPPNITTLAKSQQNAFLVLRYHLWRTYLITLSCRSSAPRFLLGIPFALGDFKPAFSIQMNRLP